MLNKIKRIIVTALIVTVIMSMGTLAFAADSTSYVKNADTLKSLGLFSGTNNGYELDRTPTRVEAAAMLVKLLGKETEAKNKNYPHPYTDVPSWADPMIGYMHQMKMTNGIGNGLFGSKQMMLSKDFTVFVLKALGYTGTDFNYADTMSFAQKSGLLDNQTMTTLNANVFKRGEMVMLAYKALSTNVKSNTYTLLDQFVNSGVVTKEAAAVTGLSKRVFVEYNNVDMSSGKLVLQNKITWGSMQLKELNTGDVGYSNLVYINGKVAEWKDVDNVKLEMKFYNKGKLVYQNDMVNYQYGHLNMGFELKLRKFDFDRVTIEGYPFEYAALPAKYEDRIIFITKDQMPLILPEVEKYKRAYFTGYSLGEGVDLKSSGNIAMIKEFVYMSMKSSELYPYIDYYSSVMYDGLKNPNTRVVAIQNTTTGSSESDKPDENLYEIYVPNYKPGIYSITYLFDENGVMAKAYIVYE